MANNNPLNNPELTLNLIHMLFSEDGTPKPELAKCIAHFKDRFREVCKKFAGETGGSIGKPASSSETTKDGSRIKLSATLTGCSQDMAPGLKRMQLMERVLTPTMEKVKFLFDEDAQALGSSWGSWMSTQRQPKVVIVAEPLNKKGEILIQAAMLFHHPSDDVYAACARKSQVDTPLPDDQFFDVHGGTFVIDGTVASIVNTDIINYNGSTAGHPCTRCYLADKYDPRGWQLVEAARSSSASFSNLKTLASRMGFSKVQEKPMYEFGMILADTTAINRACAQEAERLGVETLKQYGAIGKNHDGSLMVNTVVEGVPLTLMLRKCRWTPFESLQGRFFYEVCASHNDRNWGFPRTNHVSVKGEGFNLMNASERAVYLQKVQEDLELDVANVLSDAHDRAQL
jgi:hypothetical protein